MEGNRKFTREVIKVVKSSSHMQRSALFGCHAMVDYLLNCPSVMGSLVSLAEAGRRDTILDSVLKDNKQKDKIRECLKENTFLLAEEEEICTDLCMRNAIQNCMDYTQPLSMASQANVLLDHIFSQKPSVYNYHLLMGLFNQLAGLEVPFSSYFQFFAANSKGQEKTTTFVQEINLPIWDHQFVPKNGHLQR
jgi:hypothetical protein